MKGDGEAVAQINVCCVAGLCVNGLKNNNRCFYGNFLCASVCC